MLVRRASGKPYSRTILWTVRIASFSLFALAWELFARRVHSLLMPSFTETLAALTKLVFTRQLWAALWVSNQAMLLGFCLAAIVGIWVGLLMGRWPVAEKILDPYISILLVTPMSAVIPVVIMVAGLGIVSRVIVVFSFAVATIIVNTRAGLKTLDPSWIEMTHSFGASERQLWLRVLLRGARPAILLGLRLGLIRAVSGMITMELLLLAAGVGRMILDFQSGFEAAGTYAMVIVVVGEAVILAQFCRGVELGSSPWAGQAAGE
jgi:NitT/TauT family transport system permease protein